ncbi:MAG TPA: hypothetical protein VFL14_14885 [Xanthomonadales bacterium]|nr:hypothetical protein [Xanthomonadales bacterium]
MTSRCPKCDKPIVAVSIEPIDGTAPVGTRFRCLALDCPHCGAVLGAQIDPLAIRNDIVSALRKPE